MHRLHALFVAALAALAAACSSGGGTGGDPSAPPASVTVSGTVVDDTGAPYAGATIVIGAQSAASGADGAFSLAGVTPPYDATVIAESGNTIMVYRGVSDTTPVLWFQRQTVGTWRYAMVSGTVKDGAGQAVAARVFASSSAASFSSDATTGAYSLSASWFGDASATVNYRARIVTVGASGPTAYDYAVRPVAVTHTSTVTGQDLVLGRLASGHVTGTALSGAEAIAPVLAIVGRFGDGVTHTFWSRSVANLGAYDVVVPVVPDGSTRLQYASDGANGEHATASAPVVPGQAGVQLAIPAFPVPTGPPDYASVVRYTTPLVWTSSETGGVDDVTITCGSHTYAILGGGRSATIPDLTAYGVVLTPDVTTCTWFPGWQSGSVDDAVQGPGYVHTLPALRSTYGKMRHLTF